MGGSWAHAQRNRLALSAAVVILQSQTLTRRSTRRWTQLRATLSSEGLQYSHVSRGGRLAVPDDTGVMPSGLGSSLGDSLSQKLRNAEASPILGNVMTRMALDGL